MTNRSKENMRLPKQSNKGPINSTSSNAGRSSFIVVFVMLVVIGFPVCLFSSDKRKITEQGQTKAKDERLMKQKTTNGTLLGHLTEPSKTKALEEKYSDIVFPDNHGKLTYKPFDPKGDTVPDFSMCGYMGGGVRLPDVPVKMTLGPGNGIDDDSIRIQQAIDKISKLPVDSSGHRGTILLKKGTFVVSEPISIPASGIVLRGEGQGKAGTILYANGKKAYTVISICSKKKIKKELKTKTAIVDSYVPIGATTFSVKDASKYKTGNTIIVTRVCTKKWLDFIGMSDLTERYNNPKLKNWSTGAYTFDYSRTITAINGNKITLNAPIVEAINKEFGGGFITQSSNDRVSQCGVENLRVVSSFDPKVMNETENIDTLSPESKILIYQDTEHASVAVSINGAVNCWVRDVTAMYIGKSAVRTGGSIFITVQDCALLDPVNITKGGTKYSFCNGSQLCLFQRLYSRNARHDYTLAPRTGGPNVFLHCFSDNSMNASESHHRYGHGGLYDSCVLRGRGKFLAANRGNSGSGHGWAGAMIMFWNCAADFTAVAKPPTSQNFSIGWSNSEKSSKEVIEHLAGHINWLKKRSLKTFEYKGVPVFGDGYIESPTKPVEPHSLFLQQLKDRLGEQAVKNITVPWQRKPVDDKFTPEIGQEPIYVKGKDDVREN